MEHKSVVSSPSAENEVEIAKHLKAAKKADQDAKHHREAAKHFQDGNTDKAHESAAIALGHEILPTANQNEDPTQHAAM